jgi:hypothetical protein
MNHDVNKQITSAGLQPGPLQPVSINKSPAWISTCTVLYPLETGIGLQYVGIHTTCKGVEANGSVWDGSTPRYVKTQEAKWGAARPFTPLHQYARHVQTFPGDARLG